MTALALRSFGVAFDGQVVLTDVSLALPRTGMSLLVGPAGSGKSTLVRTLAGLNDAQPSLRTTGAVIAIERPQLVIQNARFFLDTVRENLVSALPNRAALGAAEQTRRVVERLAEIGLPELAPELASEAVDLPLVLQRRLALARTLLADPALLFVDEPVAGLADEEAAALVALLCRAAEQRAVLLITHHQRSAREAGGTTLLLVGGRIRETTPTAQFFTAPSTELGRRFLSTGGCVPPPARRTRGAAELRRPVIGPRGFFWALPGRLGGMPRPGIIAPLEQDLAGLVQLKISTLITLEETRTVDEDALTRLAIRAVHFPIQDMAAPEVLAMLQLCRSIDNWLADGHVIAVHCLAGLGRTGTLLACQLIARGATAPAALQVVRSLNPRCVQSEAQVSFLRSFSTVVGMRRPFDDLPLPAEWS